MKKLLLLLLVLSTICFTFSSCNNNKGITSNAKIEIGESQKFTKNEIEDAIKKVIEKFKDFEGCDLQKIWYEEEFSNRAVLGYISGGKGSLNGVDEKNVIVLLSDFNVVSPGKKSGLEPGHNHSSWMWILIRDSKSDKWVVDDWGY